MDYIIDQLSKYIKEGKNEEALNLLSLYRMTIESRSTYNPKYFELIQPKFDPALFRAFKKWKTKQKRSNKMTEKEVHNKNKKVLDDFFNSHFYIIGNDEKLNKKIKKEVKKRLFNEFNEKETRS